MQLAAQTQMSTSVSNPAMSKKVRSKEVIIYKYYAYVGSKNIRMHRENIGKRERNEKLGFGLFDFFLFLHLYCLLRF